VISNLPPPRTPGRFTVRNRTRFTYDPNGAPLTRNHTTRRGGTEVEDEHAVYRYDVRDLVDEARIGESEADPDPKITRFAYTPRAQVERETKANGNTCVYTYFLDGLPKTKLERKADQTTLVASHTLAYDPNGNRTQDIAKVQNADNHAAFLDHTYTYTFDPRDRIRQVTKSATGGGVLETETYTHDANGNVVSQTVDNVPTTFAYDRDRLVSATTGGTTTTHNYDGFGRLDTITTGGIQLERYTYDGFDRVREHTSNDGTASNTTRYAYDPLDRTISRTSNIGGANEERTDFNYLGLSGEVLNEEIAGQIQTSYQYSPWGQRLSQVKFQAGGVQEDSFYGYNPHYDVETLTGETGDTQATYGYTAYGKDDTEQFTGIDKPDAQDPGQEPFNVYRFNAKRFDQATGDYDMGFRDYDPGLNRFLSRDMYNGALADLNLGLSPWTMNRYGFAGGNPISFIEVDGHYGSSDLAQDGVGVLLGIMQIMAEDLEAVGACASDLGACGQGVVDSAKQAAQDPVGTVSEELQGIEDEATYIRDTWNMGAEGEAIGRGLWGGFGLVTGRSIFKRLLGHRLPDGDGRDGDRDSDSGAGMCQTHSFASGTQVLMADGTHKPIEDIRPGDQVLATDPETGETAVREVDATFPHTDQLLTLRTSAGEIVTTENHLFWNATDGQWQESQDLDPGDRLLTASGEIVTVVRLDWSTVHTAPAFDLDVADIDSFYVAAGDERVLVHNCDLDFTGSNIDDVTQNQISHLVDIYDANGGRLPDYINRGGGPQHIFENRPLPGETTPLLPVKPYGYYREADVWPLQPNAAGTAGVRGRPRLVFGSGREVYYSPTHYETFVRLR
jgi:RHS repeat-associated protein